MDRWMDRQTDRQIYCKKLACAIMVIDKSQDIQLASWRSRKANGMMQFQSVMFRGFRWSEVTGFPRGNSSRLIQFR